MGFGANLHGRRDPVELRYPVRLFRDLIQFLILFLKQGSCWGRGKLSQILGRVMREAFVTSHVYSKEENVLSLQTLFSGAGEQLW